MRARPGNPSGFSADAPTSLARGDRPARARRRPGTDALPRRHSGEHHGPSTPHRPVERGIAAGIRASRRDPADRRNPLSAAEMQRNRRDQAGRDAGQELPALSGSKSGVMSSAPQGSDRRRRVPTLRLSEAAQGRLPLPAVPRPPGHRTRPEAPGRPRRGGHRRVRGPAGTRPQGEQSRSRDLPLERPAEAPSDCGILVAATGPGTAGGTRVGALAVGFRLAVQAPLAAATKARRLRSARLGLPDAPGGPLPRGAASQGRRVPSAQQTLDGPPRATHAAVWDGDRGSVLVDDARPVGNAPAQHHRGRHPCPCGEHNGSVSPGRTARQKASAGLPRPNRITI